MSDAPETSTLLVRRADPAFLEPLGPLLGRLAAGDLRGLAAGRGVMVLSAAALPPSAPPVAAIALALDSVNGAAQLMAAGVASTLRRRGLGHRLFDGAAMLLRSEGFQTVHAVIEPGTPGAMWLARLGFRPDDGSPANRLVYWL